MNNITFKDNADGNGARWPWGGVRVHFGLTDKPGDSLKAAGLLLHEEFTNSKYGFKNNYGACIHYYHSDGSAFIISDGNGGTYHYSSFKSVFLNETDHFSVTIDKNFYDVMDDGDYFVINCTAYFMNYATDTAYHTKNIKFDNVKVSKIGETWAFNPVIEKTWDVSTFTNKVSDPWIIEGHNAPPSVNLVDYSGFGETNGNYTYKSTTKNSTYTFAETSDSVLINSSLLINLQWKHTFFRLGKSETGLKYDIVPKFGDQFTFSGCFQNTTNNKYIKFIGTLTLTYVGRNWVIGDASSYKSTIFTENDISPWHAAVSQIYMSVPSREITTNKEGDKEWTVWYRANAQIALYSFTNGNTLKFTPQVCAYLPTKACLTLEFWTFAENTYKANPTNLNDTLEFKSKGLIAQTGDTVTLNGWLLYGQCSIYFDNVTWEFNGTNWTVLKKVSTYMQGAFDSEAKDKGVLRILGVSGYVASEVSEFGFVIYINDAENVINSDLNMYDNIHSCKGDGEATVYKATDLGGNQIFGIEITGIPENIYDFRVTAYVVEKTLNRRFESAEKSYTVTVGSESTTVELA